MQVGFGDSGRAADALGDVVTGELHVDSARECPQLTVHLEVPLDLIDDVKHIALTAEAEAAEEAA